MLCPIHVFRSVIQGRSAYAPIKFNGQDFLSDQAGKGWDYRVWGEGYWWQGTRCGNRAHYSLTISHVFSSYTRTRMCSVCSTL